jgi:replicative DNA helicase Mcm
MAERPDDVVDGVDCQILPIEGTRVHSVDLETNETVKQPVDRVSRHEAPDEFVRVTFSNGRDVLVTPDHPMFVDDGGEIDTVEATELGEGAFVPAPRELPNSSTPVDLTLKSVRGKEKDVRLPELLTPDLGELLGAVGEIREAFAGYRPFRGAENQRVTLQRPAGHLNLLRASPSERTSR